jgi:hypothetical protein
MGAVTDFFESVVDAVGDIVDFVVDEIIEPIADTVLDIVEAALSDPIGTIAKAYAISTGQLYLLPYISAASTAINGGDLGDIVKAGAISAVAQIVAVEVSEFAGTAGTAAEFGVTVGSEQATALALQEVGMGTLTSITNSIAAASTSQAAVALVLGQDPMQAFISGGISSAVPAALGQIDGFRELQASNPGVANVITKIVATEFQGGNVTAAALDSIIIASGIATKALDKFDPDKKLTNTERAVATNIIINTTRAAVKGGDISDAINATLISSAVNSLGKIVTTEFKKSVSEASNNYEAATAIAANMSVNETKQNEIITSYNNIVAQIDIRSDEQVRLQAIDAANRAKYDELKAAGASTEVLNAQAAVINASTADVKSYANDFAQFVAEVKPGLDSSKKELDSLQVIEGNLQTNLTDTLEKQVELTKPVSGISDVATNSLNESFTKIIDPTFNAQEYAEINGLDATVNPYTDFMEKGRDAGVPTNLESARAEIGKERTRLVNEVLAAKGLSLDTADPAIVSKLLDSLDSTYGSNLGELRGASIQDIVNGNTRTVEELVADSKRPFRVEIAGSAYGNWKKPDESTFKVPEGYRLASTEEFESKQAQALLASDGNAVYLVPTGEWNRVVWNDEAGAYEPQSIPVLGVPPTTAEIYSVASVNNPENAGLFTTIAAVAATGAGQQIETWSNAFALKFGVNFNNTAANLGKTMQSWGQANTPTEVLAQMKAVQKGLTDATSRGSFWDKTVAVARLAKENPQAFAAYIGSEVTQEALPIGAGLVAAGVAAFMGAPLAVGLGAATALTTVIDGIEVYGSSGKTVYDARIKAGDTEDEARSKASVAGFKAALVTAPSNALANAAVFMPYLRTLGVVANTALQGVKAVTASAAGEYIETFGQSLIEQAASDPNAPLNFSEAHVKSVFASMIGAGTAGVIVAPAVANGSLVVGFDDSGKEVTYADLQNGSPRVKIETLDTNVVIGKNEAGGNVTLGDLLTNSNAAQAASDVTNGVGDSALPFEIKTVTLEVLNTKDDQSVTTIAEAQQMARDLGYTNLTNEEAQSLAGKITEANAQNTIDEYVKAHSISANTAKAMLIAAGITNPTPEQIQQFTKSGPTVDAAAIKAELSNYADQQTVDEAEARAAFKTIGLDNPTDADIKALVGQYVEADLAAKATAALGGATQNSQYQALSTAQKAEADALVAQGKTLQEAIAAAQTSTAGQIAGLTAEMKAQYDAMTAAQKATADALVAQGKSTQEAIDTAQASTTAQIAGVTAEMQAQYNSLNAAQKATADALVAQGETFQSALALAQATTAGQIAGLSADMQAKYDALSAEQKATADALVAQGKSTQEAIDTAQASTTAQIAGVTAEMQAQYNSLNAAQKATADALVAQGETFQSALALAQATTAGQIGDLSADMQTKFDALTAEQQQFALDLVALGNTTQEAITAAQNATTQQINSSTTALNARIDQLVAEGKTQQEASQQAFAEVNTRLGTQGRAPTQSDLDTLQKMIDGTIPADIRYDTNQDGKITPADYDYLTNIITRPNVEDPFKPGPGSVWSPTGLYGELDEAERGREADRIRLEEQRATDVAEQKEAAAKESLRSQRQVAGTATRQALQDFAGTAPTLIRQATQQEATPIYGGAIKEFDFGAPLDYSFFEPSKEKQSSQTGQQTTKIATGGYLDDLLAENMTADDLLKLLR